MMGLLSFGLAEGVLRIFFAEDLYLPDSESKFWVADPELGWRHPPDVQGVFSNGYYRGEVTLGDHGQRENSKRGTFQEGWENILFIGDSTTASFEVNDDQTVPALLEKGLRSSGLQCNVLNLGVRGYGTDQSVKLALKLLPVFPTTRVIYYYTGNDFDNNNTVHRRGRRFAKSVFIRDHDTKAFQEEFLPVPSRPDSRFIHVCFDSQCRPVIRSGRSYLAEHFVREKLAGFGHNLYLVRALNRIMYRWWLKVELDRLSDFRKERRRCSNYLEYQMRFLLQKLRHAGIRDLFVIGLADREAEAVFDHLVQDGTIDRFIELHPAFPAGSGGPDAFHCRNDAHFNGEGNELIAEFVMKGLSGSLLQSASRVD